MKTKLFKYAFPVLFLSSLLLESSLTYASRSFPEKLCTPDENWPSDSSFGSERLSTAVSEIIDNANSAGLTLLNTYRDQKRASNPSQKLVLDYVLNRAFFELKQIKLAHQGFQQMIAGDFSPNLIPIHVAAVACLNQIREKYPTLNLSQKGYASLLTLAQQPGLNDPSKNIIYKAILHYVSVKAAQGNNETQLSTELSILRNSGTWEAMVRLLLGARAWNEAQVVAEAKAFKKGLKLPSELKHKNDYIHLTLGQAYYGLRQYDQAISEFKQVENSSNDFDKALTALSWAHLMKENYSEAYSVSSNLRIGPLRLTFSPEAYLVGAIALNESCNFQQATTLIKTFRSAFKPAWFWLYNWMNSKNKNPNLYSILTSFLTKKTKIPDMIANEWIRSPAFIALQAAINLIETNPKVINNTLKILKNVTDTSDNMKLRPVQNEVSRLILSAKWNPTDVPALISRINVDLTNRTRKMYTDIRAISDNLKLVEGELYDNLGDKMIENEGNGPRTPDGKRPKLANRTDHSNTSPTWDWGTISSDESDTSETWVDEIGALETEIKNQCK